ncbi:MAG: hypothetical protein ABJE10_11140 [bacterium]
MRPLTQLMGALLSATVLTACDVPTPLATAPTEHAPPSGGVAASADKNTNDGSAHERAAPQVVAANGDITVAVNNFRTLLGTLNPNIAGEQPGGRREINWDAIPATFTNNDLFPGNFFNVNSPRGAVFTTPGSAFRIADNGYVDVNAAYAGEFNVFSPPKLFVARGSTIVDVQFRVAGANTPALVTGFGSVFADVGRERKTTIEFFDAAGRSLLIVASPKRTDAAGLSFVGAVFAERVVARVRITSGDLPIGPTNVDRITGVGEKHDIVAMDDFIYGEPRARR